MTEVSRGRVLLERMTSGRHSAPVPGWRFSLANSGMDDLGVDGLGGVVADKGASLPAWVARAQQREGVPIDVESLASLFRDRWAPLVSPWRFQPWPAGWVTATCSAGCAVPGPRCQCGVTFLDRLSELVWYLLAFSGQRFLSDPRTAQRLVVIRSEVSGRVQSWNGGPDYSAELRAERGRVVEMWVPAAGQRFADTLQDFYDAPVHVGHLNGEEWLRALAPDLPEAPEQGSARAPVAAVAEMDSMQTLAAILRIAGGPMPSMRYTP